MWRIGKGIFIIFSYPIGTRENSIIGNVVGEKLYWLSNLPGKQRYPY